MNRLNKTTLLSALFIFTAFMLIFAAPAKAAGTIDGKIEYVEGSRFGIGDGFSFQFNRKAAPAVAYYDRNGSVLKYAHVSKRKWQVEVVSLAGFSETGLYSSLCFDKGNNPHIAFMAADRKLKLASKKDGKWTVEEVDSQARSGFYCSMTITPGGDPIISYQSSEGTMFARKLAGAWTREKVEPPGGKTSIFLDEAGNPCVYFMGRETESRDAVAAVPADGDYILKKAVQSGGKWSSTSIPNSRGCVDFSVCLDKKGSPTITYIREKKIRIYRETVPGSGVWKEYQVGTEDCIKLSAAVKKNGFPSIAYIADKSQDLKIARFDGAGWEVKLAASAKKGYDFKQCQVVEDGKDRDLVVLFDGDSLNVLLQKGEGWGLGRIDGKIQTGGYINLQVDENNAPHVCFYDFTRKELHYAFREAGKWALETVDNTGDVGQYARMVLAPGNSPIITYYDATRGDLKFAWKTGRFWKWERVDHQGDTGVNISLFADGQGAPHITYKNKDNWYLKYAFKRGRKWIRERVVKLGEYGYGGQALVAPDGTIRVIYMDGYKAKKEKEGESPVKTFVRMATRKGPDKWLIEELAGPYAVSVTQKEMSADMDEKGEMAVTYLDRDDKLTVLRTVEGQWQMESFQNVCWPPMSARFQKDGSLEVLYLEGKSLPDARIRMARLKDNKWSIFNVMLPGRKIKYLSLASSSDGLLRLAYGDLTDFMATFFEQSGAK